VTAVQALASGQLGRLRLLSGWGDTPELYPNEHWRMSSVFARAFSMKAAKS
jgi:hypothetical protein